MPPSSAILIESLTRVYSANLEALLTLSSCIASTSYRPIRRIKDIVSSSAPATKCDAIDGISPRISAR